ncbi:MAG: transposase [Bacillota bacterium]|nr:transposase [Bacillota bacterium]
MPRTAREKSSTGIYHVVLRGINKQIIFHDEQDYKKYLKTLLTFKKISEYKIFAYCLMSNHIHLLIKEGSEEIGIVFRRIGASFVSWYNWKYNRSGHLFQDRYRSETVENDKYFLTVLRYIHQNPVKAGITDQIHLYPWSSYKEYTNKPLICDTGFALKIFGEEPVKALLRWEEFNRQHNNDHCLEYNDGLRLNDQEAVNIVKTLFSVKNPAEIKGFGKFEKERAIKKLKAKGLSIRQIERLTGISFAVIRNIK